MTKGMFITIAAIALYLAWLIVFLLVVERGLRRLVELLFGITIERYFFRPPAGKVELLDILFVFSWKVAPPASLGLRFTIGTLRFLFWMAAVITPVAIGIAIYLVASRH